jgi:hypothetical protein
MSQSQVVARSALNGAGVGSAVALISALKSAVWAAAGTVGSRLTVTIANSARSTAPREIGRFAAA